MKKTSIYSLRRSEIRSICLQREKAYFGSIYKFLSAESNQPNIFLSGVK